jgi:hypothetical protein
MYLGARTIPVSIPESETMIGNDLEEDISRIAYSTDFTLLTLW